MYKNSQNLKQFNEIKFRNCHVLASIVLDGTFILKTIGKFSKIIRCKKQLIKIFDYTLEIASTVLYIFIIHCCVQ